MKIAWIVKVPSGATLKVKNGQAVSEGDEIYEFHLNKIERIPLSSWRNLNSGDRKTILQKIVKTDLTKDEVLWKGSWLSGITIKSPGTGKCIGVDEFGNIELETVTNELYLAPISADKVRVEKERVVFELKGIEMEVDGVNQLKAWGDFEAKIFDDLDQLGKHQKGQIVIVEDSLGTAIKAEAVGVAGLILVNIDKIKEFEDSMIPVVSMKKSEVDKLSKIMGNKKSKIWLNATASKLLLVLE
jgi:phosphotransferase system IIA component